MLVKVIKEFCMSFQKKHIVILGIMMIACFVCYGSSHLEHWCYLSWANAAEFWLVFGLLFGEHLYFLGIPKVFFYVPQANGGIRSYIRMRILAETLLYFIVTLILMLATCALQMGEEVKFYTGQLQWQIPGDFSVKLVSELMYFFFCFDGEQQCFAACSPGGKFPVHQNGFGCFM